MTKVFLDTSYAIALAVPSDKYHQGANQLAEWIIHDRISIVTTRAILLEIGNSLSKRYLRRAAVDFLRLMDESSAVEVVSLSDKLYAQSLALFESRMDQEWGLVDCVSYLAMRERNIDKVLSADRHFQQMGFRALLREAQ